MQFKSDEYLLLSRRGSVPSPIRAGPRPAAERAFRERPRRRASPRIRRLAVVRGRVRAAAALGRGVRATWTAFGNGGQDL